MRVLVTGGTGLLGWWLVKVLSSRGHDVHATYHAQKPVGLDSVNWVKVSIEDPDSVNRVLEAVKPDTVVHSAAYTDVDGCEANKEYAYRVNYVGTAVLAKAAGRVNSFMIYVSTDYVFDGEKGLYSESDLPNPVNYYGFTKLLGEVAVSTILSDNSSIVRVSGLYGYSPMGKKNFGIKALESLIEGREVYAFIDQYLSPTYVPALAERISIMVEKKITGIIHIAGERVSRYDFALMMARSLGVDEGLVKPAKLSEARLVARRPRDSSLDTSRALREGLMMPPMEECIRDFIKTYIDAAGVYK